MRFSTKKGASLQGYGLMIGLVAVVALGATTSIGSSITGLFGDTAQTMDNVVTGANEAIPDPSPTPTPNSTPVFSGSLPAPGAFSQNQAITPFTVTGFSDSDDDSLVFTLSDGGSGIAADFAVTETDNNSSTADGTQVEISGTPSQTGNHILTITATDPDSASVTTGAINISVSTAGDDVYYQCETNANYVVFVDNYDNMAIGTTWTGLRDACAHYGFRMLATTNSSTAVNRESLGTSTNSNMLEAMYCDNCFWRDGGNAWYFHRAGTNAAGDNCTHIQGTAPSGAILAGGVPNERDANINCATFQQEVNSSVVFGENVSGETDDPFYLANGTNNTDPNCTTRIDRTDGAINFSGTPDYLLCAADSLP